MQSLVLISLTENIVEKDNILVTSIFSFDHNVLYLTKDRN